MSKSNHGASGKPSATARRMPTIEIGVVPVETLDIGFMKAVAAEFLCMTIFIFVTIGTACFGCNATDIAKGAIVDGAVAVPTSCSLDSGRILTVATAFGFSIAVLVYASASFSGGHLNPAVTVAAAITKKVSLMRAAAYITAQIGGAILGAYFVSVIDPNAWHAAGGGVNAVPALSTRGRIYFLELLLTALLVFVVFAATDADRSSTTPHLPVLAPFAIGLAVFISHLVAIPLDGCSINPARSLGPAVVIGNLHNQWLFWLGPICGGVLAALIYELVFRPYQAELVAVGEEAPPEITGLPAYAGFEGVKDVEEVDAAHNA